MTTRNRANANGGSGIASDDSHGLFGRNVTNNNVGHGLVIVDTERHARPVPHRR